MLNLIWKTAKLFFWWALFTSGSIWAHPLYLVFLLLFKIGPFGIHHLMTNCWDIGLKSSRWKILVSKSWRKPKWKWLRQTSKRFFSFPWGREKDAEHLQRDVMGGATQQGPVTGRSCFFMSATEYIHTKRPPDMPQRQQSGSKKKNQQSVVKEGRIYTVALKLKRKLAVTEMFYGRGELAYCELKSKRRSVMTEMVKEGENTVGLCTVISKGLFHHQLLFELSMHSSDSKFSIWGFCWINCLN